LAINFFVEIYHLELPYHLKCAKPYVHASEILRILSEQNYDKINEGKFCGACGTLGTEQECIDGFAN
jgi:hypothetical protein